METLQIRTFSPLLQRSHTDRCVCIVVKLPASSALALEQRHERPQVVFLFLSPFTLNHPVVLLFSHCFSSPTLSLCHRFPCFGLKTSLTCFFLRFTTMKICPRTHRFVLHFASFLSNAVNLCSFLASIPLTEGEQSSAEIHSHGFNNSNKSNNDCFTICADDIQNTGPVCWCQEPSVSRPVLFILYIQQISLALLVSADPQL